MEISAFAERVLVGPSLSDKLCPPHGLTDHDPRWSGPLPLTPGRAPELVLSSGPSPRTSLQVPEDSRARGELLHAFANHELLAIELLALALLRFDDAPAAFRRGLLRTLQEEQRHLSLYLKRMEALGVGFGDRPLSGFFWRAMSQLSTATSFVAHLSLTFEQANLDFAAHYQRGFAMIGDVETAAVLGQVLDDEIGHVAFGLRWFDRWRDPSTSLFDAHEAALESPLQIVRAKAASFEEEPRRRAGMPQVYIDRLRVCGGSRGRPARIFWFNGAAEQEAEHGLNFTPNASTAAVVEDFELVPAYLARPSDVVLVRRLPEPEFLAELAAAGVSCPRFEVAEMTRAPWSARALLGPISDLCPWGASPRAVAFSATAAVRATGERVAWSPAVRALYDKRTVVRATQRLPFDPCWSDERRSAQVATDWDEVQRIRADFETLGHQTRVKPVFGASGRGQRVLRSSVDRDGVEALIRRSGAVIVEPEFDVVAQFSIRSFVRAGVASLSSIGRAASTRRGQFDYAVIAGPDVGLNADVRRWLRGDGKDAKRLSRMAVAALDALTPELEAAAFSGPLGIDALLVRVEGTLRLRPLVDINPRYTMGHVAHALGRLVSSRAVAVVRATTRADLQRWGLASFPAWAESRTRPTFDERAGARRIADGCLPLTDPDRARAVVLALGVGASVDAALSASVGHR